MIPASLVSLTSRSTVDPIVVSYDDRLSMLRPDQLPHVFGFLLATLTQQYNFSRII